MKLVVQLNSVIRQLEALAEPEKVCFKEKKFGIVANNSLGIYQQDLKLLAREIGPNNELALQLYATGIYEARLLCCRLYDPKLITRTQMNKWAADFENWEICDSFCMGFFTKSRYAIEKARQWSKSNTEFTKRAAFTIMASYGFADKQADNKVFEQFFPLIERAATDQRIYVKKAVNWALRSIGKRNVDLQSSAIEIARHLLLLEDKTANWIAKDALRELQNPKVCVLDYPRTIYRA